MAFTDLNFISRFLPLFLIGFFLSPRRFQMMELFVGSLIFYSLGDLKYVPVLLALCGVNYFCAEQKSRRTRRSPMDHGSNRMFGHRRTAFIQTAALVFGLAFAAWDQFLPIQNAFVSGRYLYGQGEKSTRTI